MAPSSRAGAAGLAGDVIGSGKYWLATIFVLIVLGLLQAHEIQTYGNLSILLIAGYFMAVLVIYTVCWLFLLLLPESCQFTSLHRQRRKARIRLYKSFGGTGRYARASWGNLLDFGVTIVSLASCLMYVVETYMPFLSVDTSWVIAEVVVSAMLFAEYLLTLLLVNDPLNYIFSLFGLVNVVTTLPVFVNSWEVLLNSAVVDESSGGKLTYFRLLRLLRLLRILRAFNILQRAPKADLSAEIFYLIFIIICIIFGASGLYQWLENPEECYDTSFVFTVLVDEYNDLGCVHFHRAVYWCTISTLGRPRIVTEKEPVFLMLIVLVCLACFLIPTQLAKVWSTLQQTSKAQRTEYEPSSRWVRHLVVVGHLEFASINMLLYEFSHPDRGEQPVQDVVLLFPNPIERDLEVLLSHPAYLGHVTYLQGSPLQEKDLERAALKSAAGVIVLANKDSDEPRWHDGELLTTIQSMKAYWLKEIVQSHSERVFTGSREAAMEFLRPRIVAQVLLPETKEFLVELPGWTDHDVVVVCSEYVSWMLGMASLAKGMATLVFNLTSHTEVQRCCQNKWYPKYERGATQELYSIKVPCARPGSLRGRSVAQLAVILLDHGIVLVAVERLARRGTVEDEGMHLFPGPETFRLRRGDRLFCIARTQRELHQVIMELEGFGGASWSPDMTASSPFALWRGQSRHIGPPIERETRTREDDEVSADDDDDDLGMSDGIDGADPIERSVSSITAETSRSRLPRGCEEVLIRSCSNTDSAGSADVAHGTNSNSSFNLPEEDSPNKVTRLEQPPSMASLGSVPSDCPTRTVTRTGLDEEPRDGMTDKDFMLSRLCSRAPKWDGHIILLGLPQTQAGRPGGRGLVTELLETLMRAHSIGLRMPDAPGVCVVDHDAEERMAALCLIEPFLRRMAHEGHLRAISADPRNRDNLLLCARVGEARAVVALPEQLNQALKRSLSTVDEGPKARARQKLVKQIVDTNTVITMQVARSCGERRRRKLLTTDRVKTEDNLEDWASARLHCVTLLLQESTSNLFFGHANMRHIGAASVTDPRWMDISPLNMSPLFASGELLAMTCFDRFAVEALFTPQVVPLIRKLIFGDRGRDPSSTNRGHRLHQIAVPEELVDLTWREASLRLIDSSRIPVGVLRTPSGANQSFGPGDTEDAFLSYVMTNPWTEDPFALRSTDLLFVVGVVLVEDGSEVAKGGTHSTWETLTKTPRVALAEEVQLHLAHSERGCSPSKMVATTSMPAAYLQARSKTLSRAP